MIYLNEVHIMGRATRDAELKNVGQDSKVATFRIVSNRRIKKRSGEYEEKATFVDCEAWGQRAEFAGEYIKRGTPVLVIGRLETDEWKTPEGQNRSKLKIYCNSVQVERKPQGQGQEQAQEGSSSQPVPAGAPVVAGGDDLPF